MAQLGVVDGALALQSTAQILLLLVLLLLLRSIGQIP